MAHPLRSVSRAALGGLALGLCARRSSSSPSPMLRLRVDCTTLSPTECGFETDLARGVARLQAFAALGCALVAAGLYLAIRRPAVTLRKPLRAAR